MYQLSGKNVSENNRAYDIFVLTSDLRITETQKYFITLFNTCTGCTKRRSEFQSLSSVNMF